MRWPRWKTSGTRCSGFRPGCRSRTSGELYDIEFDDDLDVDTVGGLVALELGRVPLPGAEVVSHGLRLRAEGDPDHRGRVRIGTVLVRPVEPEMPTRSSSERA